ncbi:MAG: N-acetylmuramoyl-L-alanine amidase [Alphaproteobacteria bacterium]|nr:N-acetylmuramoyl-L-alanine amidase [Alphaproteobacteria bacterium]
MNKEKSKMKFLLRWYFVLIGLLLYSTSAFASVNVQNMRVGNQSDGARVVFDISQSINYRVFLLDNPKRVVVDLDDANIGALKTKVSNQVILNSRVGKMSGNDKRVVFDLSRPATVKKAFMIPPQGGQSWRLVVDLEMVGESAFKSKIGNNHIVTNNTKFSPEEEKSESSWWSFGSSDEAKVDNKINRKRIIVLDPGHGGKDPGAIGAYAKTYEKNVTLAMGKELKQLLQNKGYVVYLTRESDIFIPLRQRTKIAQKYKADLFMSIHADSAQNRNATGLSVYTLSDTASDKEAAALAERENKADIIGGIDLGGNTKEVNDILISLSQTDTRNKSSKYATYLVQEMSKSVKLVKNTHRFAGFAVLKAPDVPAALLEMGYLSNRTEEANLRTSSYRKKLAESVARAVDRYFKDPEIASN